MHFIKLIRPLNLLIIALTMYGVRLFYVNINADFFTLSFSSFKEQFDFFLLVFSTVLIAAGGNIINDYFDVKTDRINRPEQLIISKHIKRRWAIVTHWLFNAIAFIIAIYLSAQYNTFWYVFVHLMSINLLWFYSMYFKRKFLIGNLIIGLLTALVPILSGIHFYIVGDYTFQSTVSHELIPEWIPLIATNGFFVYVLAFFAFNLNFTREIVKDMQDVNGDKVIKAKTIPIVIGLKRSKLIAICLLVCIILFSSLLINNFSTYFENFSLFLLPFYLANFFALFACLILVFFSTKLKLVDQFIKLAMVFGIFSPYFWLFLI